MPTPNSSDNSITDYCATNQLEVVIRKKSKVEKNAESFEFILELWKPNQMLKSINLTDLEVHGDVYLDGELGGVSLNQQGTKLAYIAEEKRPKSKPFFKGYGANVITSNKGKDQHNNSKL